MRDGDEYVINGSKIFTSLAGDADYVWLATRTDPNVAKHKGISMFVVPMDTPGIRVVPMKLLGDHNINYTFYEDVRVPATSLVGGENQGWNLITNQLNHERVTLCSPGIIERVLTDVRRWAQETKLPDGRRVIDQEWVQEHLARVHAELEFLRLINWKVAWQGTQGHLDVADASSIKVFGTEFYLRAFRSLLEILGQAGYLTRGLPGGGGRRPARDVRPLHDHPHLRRRHQRDSAGPHRDLRPRHAAVVALSPGDRGGRMDFNYSEEQEAVRQLAAQICGERSTHERLKQVEAEAGDEGPFDRDLWRELAGAGLVGIHLGEEYGGAGLDFVAACLVIEAVGRTAAYVPVVETMAYGAVAVARFGTDAQRKTWLTGVASGETILTAALAELTGGVILPGGTSPATTATAQQDGSWVLTGTKACVPAAFVADAMLVPATCVAADGAITGVGVFIVDTSTEGLTLTRQTTTTGRPEAIAELAGVRVGADRLLGEGADGAAVIDVITEYAITALCVMEAGACAAALDLTAEYTKTRVQFDKPIATFQAVGQRAADAYVDTEAIRLTAWQAASRLSSGLPAASEVAVAKYWAAEGGQRVVHAASHLHGGVGVDRDYPLHRYFLLTRQIELTLGGANESLRRLGRMLADEPV